MSIQELLAKNKGMVEVDPLIPLLRRIAGQDRLAFHELYLYTSPRLYGVALALTRDRQLATEALQDAMVQVWQKSAQFDSLQGTAEAWLTGIIRFRALDLLAAGKRRLWRNYDLTELGDVVDEAALARLESTANGIRLRRCLAALDPKNQQSIILAYVYGYSHRQIASRLDLPLGTVKAWIRRGLVSLKTCVES